MTIEIIGSWASIVALIVTGGIGLVKLYLLLKKQLSTVNRIASESEELAAHIANSATNPEKRSDISLYVLLQVGRFRHQQRRSDIIHIANAIFLLWIFTISAILNKFFVIEYTHPMIIFVLISCIVYVATYIIWTFFDYKIRNISLRWERGVDNILHNRIAKHIN